MPTYDYECDACHHAFELFQSIKAEPEKKCPSCGKKKLRRLIGGGAAIMFKGSGFYTTDYRSDSYKKAAAADKSSSSSESSSKDTSSKDSSSKETTTKESSSKESPKEKTKDKPKDKGGKGKD